MALDDVHSQYTAEIWAKCRDVVEGQEAIHEKGTYYLPRLTGQSDAEYVAYVSRALFYNATQRTVDAMTGLLFRKDPNIDIPEGAKPWLDNIDLNGNALQNIVKDISDDILTVGRVGILIDHPRVVNDGSLTRAKAEDQNLRPFFVKYRAENIINWATTTVNNIKTLSLVILKEVIDTANEEFETTETIQYRVLDLFEGKYRQRVFQLSQGATKQFTQIDGDIFPTNNGATFNYIPFIFFSAIGTGADVEKPPILDLVNTNLSHYKTTADLEHGAHFTGLPTAVVTGHRIADGEVLKIGSSEAWVFSEAEAKAFYLEFSGAGLQTLIDLQASKENKMAALGARMLANEKAAAETFETHLIKRQGENSALATIADAISTGITKALTILVTWGGFDGTNIIYEVNKDFIPTSMDSATLLALLQTWQSNGIAFSDFVDALKKGEIIREERTVEEIQDEIDLEGPKDGGLKQPTI